MSKRKFDSLKTLAGKRARICQDALALMDAKKLIVNPGFYVVADKVFGGLQETLKQTSCKVCALGSALCGLTINNGDFAFGENWSDKEISGVHDKLSPYFSREQMVLIEGCFEGIFIGSGLPCPWVKNGFYMSCYGERVPTSDDVQSPFKAFKKKYKNPEKRLRTILGDVIKNRGTFKLWKTVESDWAKEKRNPNFNFDKVEPDVLT